MKQINNKNSYNKNKLNTTHIKLSKISKYNLFQSLINQFKYNKLNNNNQIKMEMTTYKILRIKTKLNITFLMIYSIIPIYCFLINNLFQKIKFYIYYNSIKIKKMMNKNKIFNF